MGWVGRVELSVGVFCNACTRDETEGFTKSVGTLSPEQDRGYAQPGCLGHEGKAVLRWHRDQGVGRGLLCPSETMQRGPSQVSTDCFNASSWIKLKFDLNSLHFIGVSPTSFARSPRMQGCPFKASPASASTPRAQTALSRCSNI